MDPPPDPWEVIARSVWLFLFPGGEWLASEFESQRNLVQYMRDLHTGDEARAIAGRIEGSRERPRHGRAPIDTASSAPLPGLARLQRVRRR